MSSIFNRLFFVAAFLLFAVGLVEKAANLFGYTVVGGMYSAGRLFEFAGIMLLFVITLLLRDVRDRARSSG